LAISYEKYLATLITSVAILAVLLLDLAGFSHW